MTQDSKPRLKVLTSGDPALDTILGGGLPHQSVNIICGEPGSGKTVLTLQLLFGLCQRQRLKAIYLTTLSEPALKLVRYMQLFSFFDERLLNDRIIFADLGSELQRDGVASTVEGIISRVEREEPDIVAIDSFKAIHDFIGTSEERRRLSYDLLVRLSAWGATSILVGEYTRDEVRSGSEFAIADGIIYLGSERQELASVRVMEVLKLRGAQYVTGLHFFDMDRDGLHFYPRFRPPEWTDAQPPATLERVRTGIETLDQLLGGGIPKDSATVVQGGSGTGKTLLALHFIVEGCRCGERAAYFTFEETPDQLRTIAAGLGWDLAAMEKDGLLSIKYVSPVELFAEKFLHQLVEQVHSQGIQRVAVDSLTSMGMALQAERLRELLYALTKHLRIARVTSLYNVEVPELLGNTQLTGHGISSIADNVLILRYVEIGGHLDRAIAVLKARGVQHDTSLRPLHLSKQGYEIGPAFAGMRGVLTGIPQRATE